MTYGFGSIEPHLPLGGGQTHRLFAQAHCLPAPPRRNAEYDVEPSLMLHAFVYAWVSGLGRRPPPPWWGVAPGPPLIVWRCCLVESTHPKVGMAL